MNRRFRSITWDATLADELSADVNQLICSELVQGIGPSLCLYHSIPGSQFIHVFADFKISLHNVIRFIHGVPPLYIRLLE